MPPAWVVHVEYDEHVEEGAVRSEQHTPILQRANNEPEALERPGECMVRGAWCWCMVLVHGAWCMVHGAWCVVHGAWCMVHGAWCMVHGAWCMVRVRVHVACCMCM